MFIFIYIFLYEILKSHLRYRDRQLRIDNTLVGGVFGLTY